MFKNRKHLNKTGWHVLYGQTLRKIMIELRLETVIPVRKEIILRIQIALHVPGQCFLQMLQRFLTHSLSLHTAFMELSFYKNGNQENRWYKNQNKKR